MANARLALFCAQRLASGGCDNWVRLWRFNAQEQRWHKEADLHRAGQSTHDDWVRDVAWAPSVGLPGSLIATCGQVCGPKKLQIFANK